MASAGIKTQRSHLVYFLLISHNLNYYLFFSFSMFYLTKSLYRVETVILHYSVFAHCYGTDTSALCCLTVDCMAQY